MSTFKSYSQHGEDFLISKYFSKKKGIIIEVGAFDGMHISNSYALYKAGWKAIGIEANPTYFAFLKSNRPDGININLAMVKDELQKEIVFRAEASGLYSGIQPNTVYFNQDASTEIRLPASTLNQVIKAHIGKEQIDCISIDVEGTEEEVLGGLDLKTYKPQMLLIEANDAQSQKKIISYMEQYGYRLGTKVTVNLFFLYRPTIWNVLKLNMPRINCTPVQTTHPLIPSATQEVFKTEPVYAHMKRFIKAIVHFVYRKYTY